MARPASLLIVLLLCLALPAPAARARVVQGIEFQEQVFATELDLALMLSGAGLVERRFLPFYVVALYVRPGHNDRTALAAGMEPCRIEIHWLTPVMTPDDARTYWHEAIARGVDPADQARLKPMLERFVTALGGAARGDTLQLDYHPDAGLRVDRNGKRVGHFAGLELNRLVLGLWLGASADREVRDTLFGAPATPAATP